MLINQSSSSRQARRDEIVGLNRLFIDRAEDTVMHPPGLAQHMPQDQRPDRTYSLRQTRNIEGVLLKRLENGDFLVEDLLHKQPHSPLARCSLFSSSRQGRECARRLALDPTADGIPHLYLSQNTAESPAGLSSAIEVDLGPARVVLYEQGR